MWQRGVNSDVVLKLQGRGTGPSIGSGVGGVGTSATGSVSLRGGRGGGSVDRGRGRGRGLGPAVGSYNRGISYEDEGGEHRREGAPAGFGRGGRPFERSQVIFIMFYYYEFVKSNYSSSFERNRVHLKEFG